MARKPDLMVSNRPRTIFGDYARTSRQSSYIEDRRGEQFRPTRTPRSDDYYHMGRRGGLDASGQAGTGRVRGDTSPTPDDFSIGPAEGGRQSDNTPTRSTRKVDPEEAVRITNTPRGN